MNTSRATRFQRESEPETKSQTDRLDDLGGEPLEGSGFEDEVAEPDFGERS